MILKKEKGNVMKLYEGNSNNIESFTLLRLDLLETKEVLNSTNNWELQEGILIAQYTHKDDLDTTFKKLAIEHKKKNENFIDVSKTYESKIKGTSFLIRDPQKHIIKIAKRDNNISTINKLNIDNDIREAFFNDCKKSQFFKLNNKYGIDVSDLELYSFWSKYMNMTYLVESNQLKYNKEKENN